MLSLPTYPFFADIRLESVDIDRIYAGVCILFQFGSMTRRMDNKPHAVVVEWNDEVVLWVFLSLILLAHVYDSRPSDLPVTVTLCGVFQLGSTLGTREIAAKQIIDTNDLPEGIHGKCCDLVLAPRNRSQ